MDIRRRHLIAGSLVAGLIALLIWPQLVSMVFILVFMGIVPGTSITIPLWGSLLLFAIAVMLSIEWLRDAPVYREIATPRDVARRHAARRRVLRRTRPARTPLHKRLRKAVARA